MADQKVKIDCNEVDLQKSKEELARAKREKSEMEEELTKVKKETSGMAARIEELEHDLLKSDEKGKATSEKLSQMESSFTEAVRARATDQIVYLVTQLEERLPDEDHSWIYTAQPPPLGRLVTILLALIYYYITNLTNTFESQ